MKNPYSDTFIFVPEFRQIVRIAEGTGDNLLYEDRDAGYVDYIYYEQHALETNLPEVDGGQIMLTELFRVKFRTTLECVPLVLEMAYGTSDLRWIALG